MITFIIIIHWATAIGDVQTRVFFTGFRLCLPCILAHGECGVLHDVLNATCMYVEYDTWYRNSVYFCAIVTSTYQRMKHHQKWEGVTDVLHEIINKTEIQLRNPLPLPWLTHLRLWEIPWKNYDLICWAYVHDVILYTFRCIRFANSHPYWDSCNSSTTKIGSSE